jgi:hypothetical protein
LGLCNGNLRTRAESATGDWLGVDPSCYLTEAEIGESTRCCGELLGSCGRQENWAR